MKKKKQNLTPFQIALRNGKKFLTDYDRSRLRFISSDAKHNLFILLTLI